MSENFDEILRAALSLSPDARAMLADHLLESLDADGQKELRQFGRKKLDLLTGVTKTNRHPEVDFGDPVGEEKL